MNLTEPELYSELVGGQVTKFLSISRPGFILALALSLVPQLAAAEMRQSSNFNVFSGKPHRVDTYLAWTDNCAGLTASAKQVRKPKNGKATFKAETTTIRSANQGSVHDCRGKKVKGLSVYYTSKPGFRGTDVFVVTDGTTVYTYRMKVH